MTEGPEITPARRIVVIDDDRHVRNSCAELLEAFCWEVRTMSGGAALLECLESFPASVVLTDVRMPGTTGLDPLEILKTMPAAPPVVLFTAHADIAMAVDAMRAGAYDFTEEPYEAERLVSTLERAVALHQTRLNAQFLRSRLLTLSGFDRTFIGQSAETRALRNKVMSLLDVSAPIMICGETGTGKHLVAHALFDLGPTSQETFLELNCAQFAPDGVVEQLRGVNGGAVGIPERIGGGTIFLGEVSACPPEVQAKLLQVV